ncbi:MAG: 30S ribosomal protein S18 [Chitinophagaceae bacterium]|nr:30S ribosomal protein S18 [Anaerolineae bacterium]
MGYDDDLDGGRGRGDRGGRRRDRDDDGFEGRDGGDDERGGKRGRRKQNSYCPEGKCFDYKDIDTLRRFVTEAGKIKPRRQTGNCSRCQRELAREIKRARHLALLPFVNSSD